MRRFVPKNYRFVTPKQASVSVKRHAAFKLSQPEFEKVVKDSYKTLITIKAKAAENADP